MASFLRKGRPNEIQKKQVHTIRSEVRSEFGIFHICMNTRVPDKEDRKNKCWKTMQGSGKQGIFTIFNKGFKLYLCYSEKLLNRC